MFLVFCGLAPIIFIVLVWLTSKIFTQGCSCLFTVLGNLFVTLFVMVLLFIALYVNQFFFVCDVPLVGLRLCYWLATLF